MGGLPPRPLCIENLSTYWPLEQLAAGMMMRAAMFLVLRIVETDIWTIVRPDLLVSNEDMDCRVEAKVGVPHCAIK